MVIFMTQERENPIGVLPVKKLLGKFAIPSIIAMLVGALYNIVDQFFIGQSVGELGNAATNIAFPLSTACLSLALLFGIGGASAFNLSMGSGEKDKAAHFLGNSASMLVICGLVLLVVTQIFLEPLLRLFGSPENVLEYAKTYTRITSIGFPFFLLSTGGGHLVRADGSPQMTMVCNLTGAVINTVLDAVFVFGFNMGMAGAALATIIGQFVAGCMIIQYLFHCKTVNLKKEHLIPHAAYVGRVAALGAAPCSNQLAMMIVQIVLNNSLRKYGAASVYGESIPLACSGIIMKVNQVFFSLVIGISQGLQPIVSFNYGAKKYDRVREGYLLASIYGGVLSVIAFATFQLFPRQIISVFGNGNELYYQFATSYFRVFLFFTFLNFMQPITSNFFTATGFPKKGMFLSLTRQIIFLLPLLVLLPLFMGIDGILYAGPAADFLAGIVAIGMMAFELRKPVYREGKQG